jgi:hypothetical protein
VHRYRIVTSKEARPGETRLLRRAFDRVAVNWADMVKGVKVSGEGDGTGGVFVIDIDVIGPPARVEIECERLFAAAWYDAFGSRGSNHIGSSPASPVRARAIARRSPPER